MLGAGDRTVAVVWLLAAMISDQKNRSADLSILRDAISTDRGASRETGLKVGLSVCDMSFRRMTKPEKSRLINRVTNDSFN